MRTFVYLVGATLLWLPFLVSAAVPTCSGCPITSVSDIVGLVTAIVNQLQIIFWIVAAGSGLYAAFLYIRSAGSAETLKKAQNQITYTVIAIALGVIAYGIPRLVDSFLRLRP